ncbi:AAA family ATPase [bacterium]|nr:AAA family ATPase [bacterium]
MSDEPQKRSIPWTSAQIQLLDRMEAISHAGGLMVLSGTRGTGKTSMAKEVQSRLGFGIYELAQDYFEQTALLISGKLFRNIDEARKFRERRVNTRILILDEILFLSLDPLGTRVLEDIVIRRHAIRKPTILITNAHEGGLNLPDSILDRVKDGGRIFQPKWGSFRIQQ